MSQDMSQSTQVMPTGGVPADRTMVAGAVGPGATQMGGTIACPVCQTTNSSLETYCSECGFLLASTPGAVEAELAEDSGLPELVEATGGRRFRLHAGLNTVGRENVDVLLMDSTVSRRHAQIAVEDGVVSVTDIGSTNGTQVDGERLPANEKRTVAPGTILRFGNATLTLVEPGAEAPAAEPTLAVGAAPGDQTLVGIPLDAGAATVGGADPAEAAAAVVSAPEDLLATGAIARLVPTTGQAPEVPLRPGTLTVGRRAGNDLVLAADPFVSGRHADITCEDGVCYLTDVGSTNGTTLNGQRMEPNTRQTLEPGDEVQIGQAQWRFERLEAGIPSEEPPVEEPGGDASPTEGQAE